MLTNAASREGREIDGLRSAVRNLEHRVILLDGEARDAALSSAASVKEASARADTATAALADLVASSPTKASERLSERLNLRDAKEAATLARLKLEGMVREVSQANERAARSKGSNAALHRQFVEEKGAHTDTRQKLTETSAELAEFVSSSNQLRMKAAAAYKEAECDRNELQTMKNEVQTQKRIVDSESRNSKSVKEKNLHLMEKMEKMETDREKMEAESEADRSSAFMERERLKDQNAALSSQNAALDSTVSALESALLGVEAEHGIVKKRLHQSTRQRGELADTVAALTAALTAEKLRLASETDSLRADHFSEAGELAKALADVTARHEEALRQSSLHKLALDQERQQRRSSELEFADSLRESEGRFEGRFQDTEKLEAEVRQLVRSNAELTSERERTQLRLDQMGREAKNKHQSADATVNALQDARRGQDEALGIVMREKETLEGLLQEETNHVRKLGERIAVMGEDGEKMAGEFGKARRERASLTESIGKMAELEEQRKREAAAAEAKLAEKDKRAEKLAESLREARVEVKDLRDGTVREDNAKLAASLDALEGRLEAASLEKLGLLSELDLMSEGRKRINEEIQERTAESRNLQGLLEAGEEGRMKLAAKLESCRAKVDKIRVGLTAASLDSAKLLKEMGGDQEGVEMKLVSWAMEKLKLDLGIVALGDDSEDAA